MTYTLPRLAAALSTAAALAACMPSPTPEQSATLQQSPTPEVYAAAGNDPKRLISMSKMRAFDYKAPVDLTC